MFSLIWRFLPGPAWLRIIVILGVAAAIVESAPWLILGFFIAGLLHEFIPQQRMKRHLGGSGWRPLLKANALGALLPICSCSAVPIGMGLVRSSAATGTALSFMMTAPTLSPIVLVMGYMLLGPTLLATYVAVVAGGAFAIGWLGNRLPLQLTSASAAEHAKTCGCGGSHSQKLHSTTPPFWHRLIRASHWGFWELGADTSGPLLVGLTIAAVLMVAMPSEWVSQWLGEPSLFAILAAVALALPAYTCSVPSLFIAQGLLLKGVSPGVVAAFIIAGPATNLGEILVLRSGLGKRTAYFYAASMLALAVLGGVVANETVSAESIRQLSAASHADEVGFCSVCQQSHDPFAGFASGGDMTPELVGDATMNTSWWRWPFTLLAATMIATGVSRRVAKQWSRWSSRLQQSPADESIPARHALVQIGGSG